MLWPVCDHFHTNSEITCTNTVWTMHNMSHKHDQIVQNIDILVSWLCWILISMFTLPWSNTKTSQDTVDYVTWLNLSTITEECRWSTSLNHIFFLSIDKDYGCFDSICICKLKFCNNVNESRFLPTIYWWCIREYLIGCNRFWASEDICCRKS